MPPREWTIRIDDILRSIERIQRYTDGMSFETFTNDDKTVDAVLYNFAVLGEAARHIPSEIETENPALPLADMRGMRNVIIHEYPGVRINTIWDTVTHDLPALVPILRDILDRAPDLDA